MQREKFLSTPSARRATHDLAAVMVRPDISIHSLREEGDLVPPPVVNDPAEFLSTPSARRATNGKFSPVRYNTISIHALREEGDRDYNRSSEPQGNFYPRPPRGGRPAARSCLPLTTIFLSTPSARRATRVPCGIMATVFYFYPRPPRGGRPFSLGIFPPVSIFLSTPSARRATLLG